MVRSHAGHDYDKAQRILGWPVREFLIAYVGSLRQQALAAYRHEELMWVAVAPHSSPRPDYPTKPSILN